MIPGELCLAMSARGAIPRASGTGMMQAPGTAEKSTVGGYKQKALISSFVAAFPMNDPRYVVLAVLDEPKGTEQTFGYATGGWVAAPTVSRVISQMAPIVGIEPIDESSPDIQEAMLVDLNPRGTTLASY